MAVRQFPAPAGSTCYAIYADPDSGQWWNAGSAAMESPVSARRAQYAIAASPVYSGASAYQWTRPAGLSAQKGYPYTAYLQAGGSPADGDTPIAVGVDDWDGSATALPGDVKTVGGQPATPAGVGLIVAGRVGTVGGAGSFAVTLDGPGYDGGQGTLTGGKIWLSFTSGGNHLFASPIAGGTLISPTSAALTFAVPFPVAPATGDTFALITN